MGELGYGWLGDCLRLYRAYYAAGGTFGLFGVPPSWTQFRLINGVAVVILLAVAIAAPLAPAASHRPSLRMVMLALCWVMSVACHG